MLNYYKYILINDVDLHLERKIFARKIQCFSIYTYSVRLHIDIQTFQVLM